jgi:heme A synthase
MDILKHAHSGIRWILLIVLVGAVVQALMNLKGEKPFNRKLSLFTMIFCHIQAVIGLTMYFLNDWYKSLPAEITDETTKNIHRFFQMEHITSMLLAVVLITIGNSRAKKAATDKAKYKTIAIFFGIALVLILASIPWPFMQRFNTLGWY